MILEALEWVMTPCPAWARRYGYLREAIAIRHRARRCAALWAAHLGKTRGAILEHIGEGAGEVVILGAGACLDVPVHDLARQSQRVILVDAVRPRGLRLPANVAYQQHDIHGIADALYQGRQDRGAPLEIFQSASHIISVNVLSQLPNLILPLLERSMNNSGVQRQITRQKILQDHVHDLKNFGTRALLIADAHYTVSSADGSVVEERPIAGWAGLPTPKEDWVWPVAPPGERGDGYVEKSRVGVWRFN